MRLKKYMINESIFPSWMMNLLNKIKKELPKFSYNEIDNKGKDAFKTILSVIDPNDLSRILKKFGINEDGFNKMLGENVERVDESAKHWWDLIKTEAFPTLAFYPALQIWLELDKILKGTEYSGKVIAFYAAFWLALISGKYIKGWLQWKKEKPGEYAEERARGKGWIV